MAGILGQAGATLSRMRGFLAPAQPALRVLDRIDPLATLAAKR
jgi:hypothetical protein